MERRTRRGKRRAEYFDQAEIEERLAELDAYYAKHGHTDVPPEMLIPPFLGPWVDNARYMWEQNQLTEEQIDLLNAHKFTWESRKQSGRILPNTKTSTKSKSPAVPHLTTPGGDFSHEQDHRYEQHNCHPHFQPLNTVLTPGTDLMMAQATAKDLHSQEETQGISTDNMMGSAQPSLMQASNHNVHQVEASNSTPNVRHTCAPSTRHLLCYYMSQTKHCLELVQQEMSVAAEKKATARSARRDHALRARGAVTTVHPLAGSTREPPQDTADGLVMAACENTYKPAENQAFGDASTDTEGHCV